MCIRDRELQLRLQSTVEGLSIAAISYYVVSLLLYGGKALKASGVPLNPEIAAGALIPVSYTHLRAHETVLDLVCRLLLEKKKKYTHTHDYTSTVRNHQLNTRLHDKDTCHLKQYTSKTYN